MKSRKEKIIQKLSQLRDCIVVGAFMLFFAGGRTPEVKVEVEASIFESHYFLIYSGSGD